MRNKTGAHLMARLASVTAKEVHTHKYRERHTDHIPMPIESYLSGL